MNIIWMFKAINKCNASNHALCTKFILILKVFIASSIYSINWEQWGELVGLPRNGQRLKYALCLHSLVLMILNPKMNWAVPQNLGFWVLQWKKRLENWILFFSALSMMVDPPVNEEADVKLSPRFTTIKTKLKFFLLLNHTFSKISLFHNSF